MRLITCGVVRQVNRGDGSTVLPAPAAPVPLNGNCE
jgi:hypothetical protein